MSGFGAVNVVRVVSESAEHGFVEINESDFVKGKHELFKGEFNAGPAPVAAAPSSLDALAVQMAQVFATLNALPADQQDELRRRMAAQVTDAGAPAPEPVQEGENAPGWGNPPPPPPETLTPPPPPANETAAEKKTREAAEAAAKAGGAQS